MCWFGANSGLVVVAAADWISASYEMSLSSSCLSHRKRPQTNHHWNISIVSWKSNNNNDNNELSGWWNLSPPLNPFGTCCLRIGFFRLFPPFSGRQHKQAPIVCCQHTFAWATMSHFVCVGPNTHKMGPSGLIDFRANSHILLSSTDCCCVSTEAAARTAR